MKKILMGTTNPSKIKLFTALLAGYPVELYTPQSLQITGEPEEQGHTPEENAILKARFYGRYFEPVICHDSGLYFDGMDLNDPRQPGLHIRTPNGCRRLDDGEMIAFYSGLVRSLGGRVTAYYLNGAAVYRGGETGSMMETRSEAESHAFYLVDKPSEKRRAGWPLDSLSLNRDSLSYFLDEEETPQTIIQGEKPADTYKKRLTAFLVQSLGL